MKIDLFAKGTFDYSIRRMIMDLRSQHLAAGGDPVDFPAYLEAAGVKADGQFIVVDGQFELMAKLKYT